MIIRKVTTEKPLPYGERLFKTTYWFLFIPVYTVKETRRVW